MDYFKQIIEFSVNLLYSTRACSLASAQGLGLQESRGATEEYVGIFCKNSPHLRTTW